MISIYNVKSKQTLAFDEKNLFRTIIHISKVGIFHKFFEYGNRRKSETSTLLIMNSGVDNIPLEIAYPKMFDDNEIRWKPLFFNYLIREERAMEMDGVSRYREHLNTTLRIQIEHSHLAHHRKSNGSEKKKCLALVQGFCHRFHRFVYVVCKVHVPKHTHAYIVKVKHIKEVFYLLFIEIQFRWIEFDWTSKDFDSFAIFHIGRWRWSIGSMRRKGIDIDFIIYMTK